MSYDIPPEQELEAGTPLKPDPRSQVEIRRLTAEEDGSSCVACGRKIRYRSPETRRPTKYVAIMFGGGMCCSQECVEVETGRRDIENQRHEDEAVRHENPPEAPEWTDESRYPPEGPDQ